MDKTATDWTFATLFHHVDERLNALNAKIDERDRLYSDLRSADKDAIETAFQAQKEAIAAALASADRAVAKSESANDKRFDGVNEFRSSLSDAASRMMPRTETEALIRALTEKIAETNSRLDRSEGHGGGVRDTFNWLTALPWVAIAGLLLWIARGH